MKQKENPNFMEIIRTYGNIIKKYAPDHPLAAFRMIKAGLALEQFRSSFTEILKRIAYPQDMGLLKVPQRVHIHLQISGKFFQKN